MEMPINEPFITSADHSKITHYRQDIRGSSVARTVHGSDIVGYIPSRESRNRDRRPRRTRVPDSKGIREIILSVDITNWPKFALGYATIWLAVSGLAVAHWGIG